MELKYFKVDTNRAILEGFLKSQWRKIVIEVHPDKGGSHEAYIEAQGEYDFLLTKIGSTFSAFADSVESYGSFDEFLANISPRVKECFIAVTSIPNMGEITICGSWVWVNLKYEQVSQREALKDICINGTRFKYSKSKTMWYWAGIASRSLVSHTFEEIKSYYGSKSYKGKELELIEA